MTTATPPRTGRPELVALITAATVQLAQTWAALVVVLFPPLFGYA